MSAFLRKTTLVLLSPKSVVFKTGHNYMYESVNALQNKRGRLGRSYYKPGQDPTVSSKSHIQICQGLVSAGCYVTELGDRVEKINMQEWKVGYDENSFLPLRF